MKTLLELRLEIAPTPAPSHYRRLRELGREYSIQLAPITLTGAKRGQPIPAAYWDALDNASAFWITDPMLLQDSKTRSIVEAKLEAGAVAVCDVRSSSIKQAPGIEFFQDLGIEPTPIGAFGISPHPRYPHPRLIHIEKASQPTAFRDTQLFRGVDSLLVQQANGLGCLGHCEVAFALPAQVIDVVDLRSDRLVYDFPKPELPVIAISARDGWVGRVIAVSAGIFHDPYTGPLGDEFPGISGGHNERIARNILQIIRDAPRIVEDTWADMYRFVTTTEYGLYHVTKLVLRKFFGEEWFERGVPEQIKIKCRERAEREKKGFSDSSYFDILDYKMVWRANWPAFQVLHGREISSGQGTAFFGGLNELRKMTMHATRQVDTGRMAPTPKEVAALRGHMAHVQWLLESAQNPRSIAKDRP